VHHRHLDEEPATFHGVVEILFYCERSATNAASRARRRTRAPTPSSRPVSLSGGSEPEYCVL